MALDTLAKLVDWLLYASIAGRLALVGVLAKRKLMRAYGWFFAYQIFNVLESCAALIPIPDKYMVARYAASQALKTVLASLMVMEIYRLALAERKALARIGRNMVGYVLAGSLLISLAWVLFSGAIPRGQALLHYTLAGSGAVFTTQTTFICLMGAFLAWFPVQIRKSLVVYIFGLVLYFSSNGVLDLLYIRYTSPREVETLNVVGLAITLACVGFWIWGMREADQDDITTTGHRWNPAEMERLKVQLDEINDSLERLVR
jgi:hypothetical protein